jgi:hypothetical protein
VAAGVHTLHISLEDATKEILKEWEKSASNAVMLLGGIASPTKAAAAYDFSKLDDEESDDFQQAVEMLNNAVRTKKNDYKDNEDSFMLSKEDT